MSLKRKAISQCKTFATRRQKTAHRGSTKLHDFESILVGQWLEKAEKSFATVPGSDPDQDQDSGHDQFQSIACQSLAQGLSRTGGFGIAAMISKQLSASAAKQPDEIPRKDSESALPVNSTSSKSQIDK
jgi:Rod binding domain-containing protein